MQQTRQTAEQTEANQADSINPVETLLLETLNKTVHAVLSVDPDTANGFQRLIGKVFCIHLTLPEITLFLIPEPDGFVFAKESSRPPDVTLSGSAMAFARLAAAGGASSALSQGQVTMQGDAEAGQMLQKLLAGFDFDWEELIARVLGDTPARKAGNVIRRTARRAGETAELAEENLVDYLQEEKQVLVTSVAMKRLETAVAAIRSDTDRLAQRLSHLQQRLTNRD